MALLEGAEARTILLLAPAGYGKTTLARQWARTLNGVLFSTLTSAHQDVSVLASGIASAIQPTAEEHVRAYVNARANPQRAARAIGVVVAKQLRLAKIRWLILDDYHEVSASPEAEEFIESLLGESECRVLIASRVRPAWASARLAVYGNLVEIGRDALAMSRDESTDVLGRRADLSEILYEAAGWPAVIGLCAASGIRRSGNSELPAALHNYLTDELYRSASDELRGQLIQIALAVDLTDITLRTLFGKRRHEIVARATDLGFLSSNDGVLELHPLFREYLFQQLASGEDVVQIVDSAIDAAVQQEKWERAFQLIRRFNRFELAEGVLEKAYVPLLRSGQLGTLASFTRSIRATPAFAPAVVDLAEAELAFRDGSFQLATRIAARVRDQLGSDHPLVSRAHAIIGQSAFVRGELEESEDGYRAAFECAQTPDDEAAALRGWALTSVQGELPSAEVVVDRLAERKNGSPSDLLRFTSAEIARRRFTTGLAAWPPEIDEALHVADRVMDPSARSSLFFSISYVFAVRAEYRDSSEMIDRADADIAAFDLDFARPYSEWNRGLVAIGERRFGEAERIIQHLEDFIAERPLPYHVLNCRILRGRLLMQTNRLDEAVAHLPFREREPVIPSIYGEYLATRALALGARGDRDECLSSASAAEGLTSAVEVRVLAAAAKASVGDGNPADGKRLWDLCERLGAWDPLLAAARASANVATALSSCDEIRPGLATLYERANDVGLARRAGIRTRSPRSPEQLLSRRELEVLGLLAQGLRNRDISRALVISESTTKVHIRHIFEKLGVRTRAEAVARFGMLS